VTAKCSICVEAPAQRDGLCKSCRCRHGLTRRKFFWTEEQIALLKWAYQAETVKGLKTRVDKVVAATGFPRQVVLKEARRHALSATHAIWSEQEKQFLCDHTGEMTVSEMAKALHRGHDTTFQMLRKLGFSSRIREGYTIKDLRQAFCVSDKKIDRWLDMGWLSFNKRGRIDETNVLAFIRDHSEEYSLKRVDEYWFKSLVFPHFAAELLPTQRGRNQYKREVA
jgi:hypothetical protein